MQLNTLFILNFVIKSAKYSYPLVSQIFKNIFLKLLKLILFINITLTSI